MEGSYNMLSYKDYQLIQILIDFTIDQVKAENGNYRDTIQVIHILQNLRNKVFLASREDLPEFDKYNTVIW